MSEKSEKYRIGRLLFSRLYSHLSCMVPQYLLVLMASEEI